MSITGIIGLLSQAQAVADKVEGVTALIEAGEQLITLIRENVELATATASEKDLTVLRERAASLALRNQALAEQVDAALSGGD